MASAVRKIQTTNDRPSIRQLKREIEQKNAQLAKEEEKLRREADDQGQGSGQGGSSIRRPKRQPDYDNVDPPLVTISTDNEDVSCHP